MFQCIIDTLVDKFIPAHIIRRSQGIEPFHLFNINSDGGLFFFISFRYKIGHFCYHPLRNHCTHIVFSNIGLLFNLESESFCECKGRMEADPSCEDGEGACGSCRWNTEILRHVSRITAISGNPPSAAYAATPLSERGHLGAVNPNAFSYSNGAWERTGQKAPFAKELSARSAD